MELVERIARVIAGYRLSANADGAECSAAESVDTLWAAHQDEAVAILKTLREPSPTMVEAGMHGEWGVMIDRELNALAVDGIYAASPRKYLARPRQSKRKKQTGRQRAARSRPNCSCVKMRTLRSCRRNQANLLIESMDAPKPMPSRRNEFDTARLQLKLSNGRFRFRRGFPPSCPWGESSRRASLCH